MQELEMDIKNIINDSIISENAVKKQSTVAIKMYPEWQWYCEANVLMLIIMKNF